MILAKEKENKRPEILAAAAHLFRLKGYERATTRELAGAVDLQSGSIFHYFASKEAILRAIVEEALGKNIQAMRDRTTALNSMQQPQGPPPISPASSQTSGGRGDAQPNGRH